MSMDYYANAADVVDCSFVEQICPEEYKAFVSFLEEKGIELWLFASDETYGNNGIIEEMEREEMSGGGKENSDDIKDKVCLIADKIHSLYEKLCEAFSSKTDLLLSLQYHDAESRGDEVDGAFWRVEGVWQRTSAAEQYKDKISQVSWVTFG